MIPGEERDLAVAGYFGEGNFGDDLLAERMLDLLCRHFAAERIAISSSGRYLERWFPGVRCVPIQHLLRGRPRKVILGGGGLLFAFSPATARTLWGLRQASGFRYWRVMGFGRWQRCSAFGYCLGVGPVEGRLGRWATRRFLAPVEQISVRDARSAVCLNELGVAGARVTTDPVCSLAPWPGGEGRRRLSRVGVVIRAWPFGGGPHSMLPKLVEAAGVLRRREREVQFVSFHDGYDREAIGILGRLGETVRRWRPEQETIADFRGHMAGFGVIASMRAHGLLLGAIDGAATVAIAIEPKLRVFTERYAAGSPSLETDCRAEEIVEAIERAGELGPPRTDWRTEQGVLQREQDALLGWLER